MLKCFKNTIFLFFLTAFLSTNAYAEVLEFAQISDVNYVYDNKSINKYLYFLNLSLQKQNADFAVFLGDNIEKSTEENAIGFMQNLYSIRIPYYVVLGNNDSHKVGGLEKEIFLDIVTTFNQNQKDRENYYYFKPNKDFICVVLDDTSNFMHSNHGEVPDEQLQWLDKLLKKYSKKTFIIFEHSPLNPPRDEYKLSMLKTEKYKEVIKKHNNVLIMSSGHYKQASVKQDDDGIWHISAPAFSDFDHSYQLVRITYDKKFLKLKKKYVIEVKNIKV